MNSKKLSLIHIYKTFKALSDPTRRQILELLRRGPKSAGEISEQFGTCLLYTSRCV